MKCDFNFKLNIEKSQVLLNCVANLTPLSLSSPSEQFFCRFNDRQKRVKKLNKFTVRLT